MKALYNTLVKALVANSKQMSQMYFNDPKIKKKHYPKLQIEGCHS